MTLTGINQAFAPGNASVETDYRHRLQCGLLISVLAISACASPYYGYSKEERNKLSEQQQLVAKKEFADMRKKKKELEHVQLLREREEQVIRRGLGQPY